MGSNPSVPTKNSPIAQLVQSDSLTRNRSSVRSRLGLQNKRFLSSVGSVASVLHAEGHRFESYRNHILVVSSTG